MCAPWCRKRGIPTASATSKFACCRMCMRLQDHCDGSVMSSRLLPARKKEKHRADRNCLSSRLRLKAHTRGHPCRECWRQACRARLLIRHAPGACHQQGISRPHPSLAVQGATALRAGLFCRGASPLSPAFLFRLSLLAPIAISIAMPAQVSGGGRVSDAGASLTFDPMTHPKLVCACLPLSSDPVSLPR
mgnify:CR=1 FL=1